jgi:hypothetical protein
MWFSGCGHHMPGCLRQWPATCNGKLKQRLIHPVPFTAFGFTISSLVNGNITAAGSGEKHDD